jgi:hypothetical protein
VNPPLLLVDIDGVISLFGFDAQSPPPGRMHLVDGIPHFLSTQAAELLIGLASTYELVWCSGWEDRADDHLPVTLGVPAGLPHLVFEGSRSPTDATQSPPRHWKLDAIDAYAEAGRPLAWIDDAFDESCHRWAERRRGPTLLVETDPRLGLTIEHGAQLRAWAAGL